MPNILQSSLSFFNVITNLLLSLKLGTYYPWTRPVNTGVILDTPVHSPWTRPVNTGAINHTGRVGHQCIASVNTSRVHGCPKWRPCARIVRIGRKIKERRNQQHSAKLRVRAQGHLFDWQLPMRVAESAEVENKEDHRMKYGNKISVGIWRNVYLVWHIVY